MTTVLIAIIVARSLAAIVAARRAAYASAADYFIGATDPTPATRGSAEPGEALDYAVPDEREAL